MIDGRSWRTHPTTSVATQVSAFDPKQTLGEPDTGQIGTSGAIWRFEVVPRFYFHLHNDVDAPDDEGIDLPHFEAA